MKNKLIEIKTRPILDSDIKSPVNMVTARFFHRTSEWKYVEHLRYEAFGEIHTIESSDADPVYCSDGNRDEYPFYIAKLQDGIHNPCMMVYMPCNKKLKYFFIDMKGGQDNE